MGSTRLTVSWKRREDEMSKLSNQAGTNMDHHDGSREPCVEPIILEPMSHQVQVWKKHDDWAGVTSTQERRKLQNRLNQRAYS